MYINQVIKGNAPRNCFQIKPPRYNEDELKVNINIKQLTSLLLISTVSSICHTTYVFVGVVASNECIEENSTYHNYRGRINLFSHAIRDHIRRFNALCTSLYNVKIYGQFHF